MSRFSRCLTLLLLVLLSGLAPLGLASYATAQDSDNGWSEPIDLSIDNKSSWFPDIAAAPDGSIHVIWSSGLARGSRVQDLMDLLIYRSLRDGEWSKAQDIMFTGTGGFAVRNSITMGHDGQLHVLMRNELQIRYSSAKPEDASSARGWKEQRRINRGDNTAYYNALAMDSRGTLHAFWNENVPNDPDEPYEECPNCSDIFYRRSTDNGTNWSDLVNLSNSLDGDTRPQVQAASDDTLHLVWDEGIDVPTGKGTPKTAKYRRSRDGGTTWDDTVTFSLPSLQVEVPPATPRPLPTTAPGATPVPTPTPQPAEILQPNPPRQVALGLFQNQQPIVVYRATLTDQIYYQFSSDAGETWSEPLELPGVRARFINETPFDGYTMATDGAGNVHLVVVGFREGIDPRNPDLRPRLLHLVWDGESWSAPEVILANDLYPEWPRLVVHDSQLHLVWFTRRIEDLYVSDNSNYRVWYSSKTIEAPPLPALRLFTPTPVPPATQTPTPIPPTPTPTPLPPEIAQAPLLIGRPAWEAPGMVVIGLAALPVLGLLALLFIARRLLRR